MAKQEYLDFIRSKVGHERIFLTGSCALVLDDEGRLLIQQVPSGKWGLPGGLCELGESAAETAVRETREETGLDIEIDELWGVYTKYDVECANGDKFQSFVTLFTAHITGGELFCDQDETLALRFVTKEDLPDCLRVQHRDMIMDYFEGRKGSFR